MTVLAEGCMGEQTRPCGDGATEGTLGMLVWGANSRHSLKLG